MEDKIKFSDWQKFDFRVGEIIKVDDHPNADKLYVLVVDIGEKKLQLVAGIKKHYDKEYLIGKKVIVFVNLEEAMIRGVKSQGMLLAAQKDENVFFLTPEKNIDNGAKIR